MSRQPTIYDPVLLVQCYFNDTHYFSTRSGVYGIDGSRHFYRGLLVDSPTIRSELSDLFYGVERSSTLTLTFNDRDKIFVDIVGAEDIIGRWVSLWRYQEVDGDIFEFRGKITSWSEEFGIFKITLQMRDDMTLDTILPRKTVNTTDFPQAPDTDINKPIALPFGHCRNVPLRHVLNDTAADHYDYVIAYTGSHAIEGIWTGPDMGVKRDDVLVNPAEYTFFDGSQSSPYPGFAFIRFTKEQRNFSNNFHNITADVKGLKLGTSIAATRNFATILRYILADTDIGIGDYVDVASFDQAASDLNALGGMYCDYAVTSQQRARDVIDKLLYVCRGNLERNVSGYWTIKVDTQYDAAISDYFGDSYGGVVEYKKYYVPRSSQTLGTVILDYAISKVGEPGRQKERPTRRKSVVVTSYGKEKKITSDVIAENSTADRFLSYLYGKTRYANRRVELSLSLRARNRRKGDIVWLDIPHWNISGRYRLVALTRNINKYDAILERYDSNIYNILNIPDPTDPEEQVNTVEGVKWDGVVGNNKPADYAANLDNNLIRDPEFKEAAYGETDFWQLDHAGSTFGQAGGKGDTTRLKLVSGGNHRNCYTSAVFPCKQGDIFVIWGEYALSDDFDDVPVVLLYVYDKEGNVLGYPRAELAGSPKNTWLSYAKTIEVTLEGASYCRFAAHLDPDATQGFVNWSSFYAGRTDGRAVTGLNVDGRLIGAIASPELQQTVSGQNGFFVDAQSIRGVKNGTITFEIDLSGNAKFAGVLEGAEIQTTGGLRVLNGGNIDIYSGGNIRLHDGSSLIIDDLGRIYFRWEGTTKGGMNAVADGVRLDSASDGTGTLHVGDLSRWEYVNIEATEDISLKGYQLQLDSDTGVHLKVDGVVKLTTTQYANRSYVRHYFTDESIHEVSVTLWDQVGHLSAQAERGKLYILKSGGKQYLYCLFEDGTLRLLASNI